MYGLQFSDKTSLSAGVVFGLREDTGLVGKQYNNLTTFFCESLLSSNGEPRGLGSTHTALSQP